MHKNKSFLFGTIAGFLAAGVLLAGEAQANLLAIPNLKGQFKKESLKNTSQVTMQADQVTYSAADNKAHAKGNVVLTTADQRLTCDQMQLDRTTQEVEAQGNVYLDMPQEQVLADGLTYNFEDSTGEFRQASMYLDPYKITGQKLDKLSEDHMAVEEGYLTTCDLDQPHYRVQAKRMDVYVKDKAVLRKMKIFIGNLPVMYMPYYVQDLKNKPMWTIIPGENKAFGYFLLTSLRFRVGEHLKLTVHEDLRERAGFGEGLDVKYDTPNFGQGMVSGYYATENLIASHHLFDLYRHGVKRGPTNHHTLYRVVWRHHWRVDKDTDVVLQYYRLHDYDIKDNYFLKNYFRRDYMQNAQNSNYDTYFVLTHVMPHGTFTFNVDTSRENRAMRGVERIPELQYVLNNTQIGKTGFYVKSTDTYSNLSWQNYPKTFNYKTQRFDSNNDISHPFKVGFISFNPHAGGEETYYSRTAVGGYDNIVRGIFRTSLDMSTKFYKVFDVDTNFAGMDIHGLRHVITPTITYFYQARPTVPTAKLNQFDAIDNMYEIHQLQMGLENKLQTKRNGQIVDLLRFLIQTNYGLKGTTEGPPAATTGLGATGREGFNPVDFTLDFNPTNWLAFHDDSEYDFDFGESHWVSHNFDVEVHDQDKWAVSLGNRYTRYQGDQVTSEFDMALTPKWKFKVYNTYPLVKATNGNTTSARENEFVLTRDLHEWEMDLTIDQQQGQGSTFYIVFRLKAMPGMKFNLVQSAFQASKPGAQPGSSGM